MGTNSNKRVSRLDHPSLRESPIWESGMICDSSKGEKLGGTDHTKYEFAVGSFVEIAHLLNPEVPLSC